MKIRYKSSLLESVMKKESDLLKRDIISAKKKMRLSEIAKRKEEIKNLLNEMDEGDSIDEFFNFSKLSKALKNFKTNHQGDIEDMKADYKSNNMSYIEKSKELLKLVDREFPELVRQFGINDISDKKTLRRDMVNLVQPMNYTTFSNKASKGSSISDFAGGSTGGRT